MMRKLLAFIIILTACEEVVDINLKEAPSAVVVDAWLNDKEEVQIIKLTETQPYFDSSEPKGVAGANVTITDSEGNVFAFTEGNNGEYFWDPASENFGITTMGTTYTLDIGINGLQLAATTQLNRTTTVDSILFTFKPENSVFEPEGYYGEFLATDVPGAGDTYWIKAYKNGVLLNNPFDLNIAYDAGFNAGGNIDGFVFIQPIQNAVTPLNEDLDELVPYVPDDSLYVEIHSISNEAFYFLQQVQLQTQRSGGFGEIFATPLENVSTNISIVSNPANTKVVGFFNVAAVEGRGRRLEE